MQWRASLRWNGERWCGETSWVRIAKGPCTLDSCIQQVDRRAWTNGQIWTRGKEEGNVGAAVKHFTFDVVLLSHPPGDWRLTRGPRSDRAGRKKGWVLWMVGMHAEKRKWTFIIMVSLGTMMDGNRKVDSRRQELRRTQREWMIHRVLSEGLVEPSMGPFLWPSTALLEQCCWDMWLKPGAFTKDAAFPLLKISREF